MSKRWEKANMYAATEKEWEWVKHLPIIYPDTFSGIVKELCDTHKVHDFYSASKHAQTLSSLLLEAVDTIAYEHWIRKMRRYVRKKGHDLDIEKEKNRPDLIELFKRGSEPKHCFRDYITAANKENKDTIETY